MQEIKINVTLTERQVEEVLIGLDTWKDISNRNRSGHASTINPIMKMLQKEMKKAKKEIGAGQ